MRKRILALEELMTDEPAVDSTAAAPAADASADTPTEASTDETPAEAAAATSDVEVAPTEASAVETPVADAAAVSEEVPVSEAPVDAVPAEASAEEVKVDDTPASETNTGEVDETTEGSGEPAAAAGVETSAIATESQEETPTEASTTTEVEGLGSEAAAEVVEAPKETPAELPADVVPEAVGETSELVTPEGEGREEGAGEGRSEAPVEGEGAPAAVEGGVDDDLTLGEVNEGSDDDLDESMAAVVTSGAESDALDADIEEASSTADTLGKIGERMEATLPEGGMGEVAVESLSAAIKHMCSQIGYKPSRSNVFPAMEGFQNPKTRVQATKYALEDLKSKVGEIWAALVAMIKKAMLAAKHFYANATSAAKAIIFQAGKLRDHAKKIDQNPGTVVRESKVAVGPRLIVQGHAVSGDAFVKAVFKHVRQDVLSVDRIKMLENAGKAMEASEANEANKGKENQSVILHASDVLKKVQGMHAGSVPLIFGGTSVITEINDNHASVHLDTVDANDGGEVDPLDSHQVIAVCSEIISHMSGVAKAYGSAGDEAVAAVTDILHKAQTSLADATSAHQAGNRIKQLIAVTVTASKTLASYDLHVCKDALGYAQKSLTKDEAAVAA